MTEFDYVLPRLDAGDEDDKSVAFFIRRLQAEIERLKKNEETLVENLRRERDTRYGGQR